MKAFYHIWRDCIPPDQCDHMKAVCEQYEKIQAKVLNGSDAPDDEVRKSQIAWVTDSAIKHTFMDLSSIINYSSFGYDLYQNINTFDLQYTEYEASYNGKFDWHLDISPQDHFIGDRKLTVILQLSDLSEYSGGELELEYGQGNEDLNLKELQKGTLICFPTFILHRIKPITKGKRNSLIAWINGPSFR
jgi:PKHD-type hydroxylase